MIATQILPLRKLQQDLNMFQDILEITVENKTKKLEKKLL